MKKQIGLRLISMVFAVISAVVFSTAFCACGKGEAEPSAEPYPRDFMCGYFMVFYDGEEAITDEKFESPEAVKCYFYKNNFSGGYTTFAERGLQIYDGMISVAGLPLEPEESGSVEICDTFYVTPELYRKRLECYAVYYNSESGDVYRSDSASRYEFGGGLASISLGDEMSAKVLDGEGNLRDISYSVDCTLNFMQIDELLEIEFSYFNANGERVHSVTTNDFTAGSISMGGEYDYVVISKKYEKADGEIYYKRSICDKSDQPYTERVYVPYGNGFTKPVDITLDGSEIEIHPLTVV